MRRAAIGAILGLFLLLVGLTPVAAQDGVPDDGGAGEGDEQTSTPVDGEPDPVDGPVAEGGVEGDAFAPDQAADPVPGEADPAVGGEEEPVPTPVPDFGGQAVEILQVDGSTYPSVSLVISVPPALAGELVPGNFAMTEGNLVVPDLRVSKLRDAIEVVLVVDTSGSMAGAPIEGAKAAAREFVAQLDDNTRIAVVGFGATATTVADFDSSRAEVDAAIGGLVADGKTALYDALLQANSQLSEGDTRRFVVVLSDGADTASSATASEATSVLSENDVNLYAITLSSAEANFADLRQLVANADGQVVSAADTESLSAVYSALASRLSNQYLLSFTAQYEGTIPVAVTVSANGALGVARESVEFVAKEVTARPTPGPVVRPEATAATASGINSEEATGFFNSENAMWVGAGALFLALLGILMSLFTIERIPSSKPSAFAQLDVKNVGKGRGGLASIGDRASNLAESAIKGNSRSAELDSLLERGGVEMRPGEFVTAAIGAAVGCAAMGLVFFGLFGLPGGFIFGLLAARFVLKRKARKRENAFGAQLGDTLIMMAGGLRAGHGIAEAIDSVASQAQSPTGDEFSRVVSEARIGRDLVESLYDVADRTNSEDFIWVVRAISINRELGGDLAEILDNVGDTIRDRNRLRDQVKALSAEGKISALVLVMLPIGVTGWVKMSNPEYLASMTDVTAGKIAVGFAATLLMGGVMWLKKLINVEF